MNIKNIKLTSYASTWKIIPTAGQELEQKLTINASGRVWLSRYEAPEDFGKYKLKAKEQFSIGKNNAEDILNETAHYFFNRKEEMIAMDAGTWDLIITEIDGTEHKFFGSMIGLYEKDGKSLSKLIKRKVGKESLLLFGND